MIHPDEYGDGDLGPALRLLCMLFLAVALVAQLLGCTPAVILRRLVLV